MPNIPRTTRRLLAGFAAYAASVPLFWAFAGCAAPRYDAFPANRPHLDLPADPSMIAPRDLPLYAGQAGMAGSPLRWDDLLAACDWADIVIIGEQHDDALGHAVQLAIVEDVFDRAGRNSSFALAMEMLERDEQILVDDYLEGIIDAPTFIRLTHSANWGGEGMWEHWFQPIIDAAKARGASVVAANAPRRYVRLARLEGYERLRRLPRERRAFFDLPRARARAMAGYRARFGEVMRHVHGDMDEMSDEEIARREAAQERRIDAAFRSQTLWDSTMAASIVRASPAGRVKVVHLVGQFHSDFAGGLVQELRARRPQARILTISMQRAWPSAMREEDRGRADVIIYTGERPVAEDVEDVEEEEEESDATLGHCSGGTTFSRMLISGGTCRSTIVHTFGNSMRG